MLPDALEYNPMRGKNKRIKYNMQIEEYKLIHTAKKVRHKNAHPHIYIAL